MFLDKINWIWICQYVANNPGVIEHNVFTGRYTKFRTLGFCCKHRKTAAFLTDIKCKRSITPEPKQTRQKVRNSVSRPVFWWPCFSRHANEHKHNTCIGSNKFSQIKEFHSKEALFGNMVKPVWNPSTLLEKGSGRLCLINQGLLRKNECITHSQKDWLNPPFIIISDNFVLIFSQVHWLSSVSSQV